MKLLITKKDISLVFSASILLLAVIIAGWLILGETVLFVSAVLSNVLILLVLLEVYRKLSKNEDYQHNNWDEAKEQASTVVLTEESGNAPKENRDYQLNQDYLQIEALFSLFFTLKPSLPLPNTRGWAISPDLLKKITEVILIERPSLIVELGSGVSTLIIAYCLKQLGKGKVISLEHNDEYVAISQNFISSHKLEEIATIIYAPLKTFEIDEETWLWYNTDCLKIEQPIDLLVVDGPPKNVQKLSRYPALPLLYKDLNEHSIIILDDGDREDEKKIIEMWKKEFSQISSEFIDTEKGAYIIYKNHKTRYHTKDNSSGVGLTN